MSTAAHDLDNISVVLYRPQRLFNIAGVVRAMLNTGLRHLRLVAPAEYEPHDIAGVVHRSADLLAHTQLYDDLDSALADATFVVGTSARARTPARHGTPREFAAEIRQRALQGPVALLFGPEDNGLDNVALDRCDAMLTIPVDPAYRSLNLAQAVLLVTYEIWMNVPPIVPGTPPPPPATAAQLARLMTLGEQWLWSIDFFKAHQARSQMRSVERIAHRADLSEREAALLIAMLVESRKHLTNVTTDRTGAS